jgi:hypothetical protein
MALWLPRRPRLWDGLRGSRFVFLALDNPVGFRVLARQLDPSFFFGVSRSETMTVPLVRVRRASPVRHHVRVRWELSPASCRTSRIVSAAIWGRPALRRASRRNIHDPVTV